MEIKENTLPQLMDSYRNLTNQMEAYFTSLNSVDAFFERAALRYHEENAALAAIEQPTEEEISKMVVNLAYAAATKGVGSLYKAIKTELALAKVKDILKAEGERRLPELVKLQKKLSDDFDKTYGILEEVLNRPAKSFEDAGIDMFNSLRTILYMKWQTDYLIATYEDAIQGRLQDRESFPSMYTVNCSLLFNVLMPIGKSSSQAQEQEARRGAIDRLIASIQENLNGRLLAKARDLIFASDSAMMGVAIAEITPNEDIEVDEDGYSPINEDSMLPDSLKDYMKIFNLLSLASRRPDSLLGNALLSNKTLEKFVTQISDISAVSELYNKKQNLYLINNLLFGALTFLASIDRLGLKWYWSLLIAIVVFSIGTQLTPFSSLRTLVKKKLTYIDHSIVLTALSSAGYSEQLSLQQIQNAKNRIFLGAILGGIAGLCFIPFPGGLIIGALIGAWFGSGKEDAETPDFNYEHIKIGSVKSICLMVLLILGILAYSYFLFF